MRKLTVLALIAATGSLSSCGTPNRGLESVHQPVVARTDYVFDLAKPGGDTLSYEDASRLSGWFDSVKLRYGDHVSVDAPGDDRATRTAVGDIVARYGLLLDESVPVTNGEIAPGSFRVVISRTAATVPNCPDWSRPAAPNFEGHTMSNYGCATNTNIAAMVADPRDLVRGREASGNADIASSTKAIDAYRAAAPSGDGGQTVKAESTKGN